MPGQIEVKGLPRLAREGFGSPVTGRRVAVKHMLLPKPRERTEFIPAMEGHWLSWLAGKLGPPERRALREIVETGDLVKENGHTYLIARVSSATIDALAAFEAEGEDREPIDLEDEPETTEPNLAGAVVTGMYDDAEEDNADLEPDHDNEPEHHLP